MLSWLRAHRLVYAMLLSLAYTAAALAILLALLAVGSVAGQGG